MEVKTVLEFRFNLGITKFFLIMIAAFFFLKTTSVDSKLIKASRPGC